MSWFIPSTRVLLGAAVFGTVGVERRFRIVATPKHAPPLLLC